MYSLKQNQVYTSEIATYLNTGYVGEDIIVSKPINKQAPVEGGFFFIQSPTQEDWDKLSKLGIPLSVIANFEDEINYENISIIKSQNSEIDFYRVVNEFFVQSISYRIESSANVHHKAKIGLNVHIGKNAIIGENVIVGNNVYIGDNVTINGEVQIATSTIIQDGAKIGRESFSFLEDGNSIIYKPQFGQIIIGESVWIGANSTIERPTFGKTIIGNKVKIDDLVHIGQGVVIRERCQVTAGVVIARDANIGKAAFLGIGSVVRDSVNIGDHVLVGMGSVVVSNLESNKIYKGNPAKEMVEKETI